MGRKRQRREWNTVVNKDGILKVTIVELLRRCTVRIYFDGAHKGAGFFVTPHHVVTCAHVVKDVNRAVKLNLLTGKTLDATVIDIRNERQDSNGYPDLALIEIADKNYSSDYVALAPSVKESDRLFSYGFTQNKAEGESLTTSYEGPFQVKDYNNADFMKLKHGQVVQGFSGSPLLNERTGEICGLIYESRDFNSDLGGYGVSASLILDCFKLQLETAQSLTQLKKTTWGKLCLLTTAANRGKVNQPATFNNFYEHWMKWSAKNLPNTSCELLKKNLVPSPIDSDWEVFLHTSWRNKLFNALVSYQELVLKHDSEDIPHFIPDISGAYTEVCRSINVWLKTVRSKLHELEIALKKELPRAPIESDIYVLKKRILKEIEEMSTPDIARLGVIFPIFGYVGCGKTEFLRSRAIQFSDAVQRFESFQLIPLLLPLKLCTVEKNIEKVILERVTEASGGYSWSSLEELDDSLRAFNCKLVIMVDDFERILSILEGEDFLRFIEANAKFDSLAYLFAIQDTQLDLISGSRQLWKLYSFDSQYHKEMSKLNACDRIPQMAGWINLAEFNKQNEIGYKILRKANQQTVVTLLMEQRYQPSPLEAQLLLYIIENGKDVGAIGSLNFFGFVDKFRETLLDAKSEACRRGIRLGISAVAKSVVSKSSLTPTLNIVKNKLILSGDNDPDRTVSLLKDVSLLGINELERGQLDETVRLNFSFFWNSVFAEQIWNDCHLADNLSEGKAIKFLKKIKDEDIRNGIWEFVLLLSDQKQQMGKKAGGITAVRAKEIWVITFKQEKLSIRSACFAARWTMDKMLHQKVASELSKRSRSIVEKGELFALIFFAMETPTLSSEVRLDLLSDHYPLIQDKGLAGYFLFGVERMLLRINNQVHLESCLAKLATSHLTGCETELAELSWQAFLRINGVNVQNNLKLLMNGYLKSDRDNSMKAYNFRDEKNSLRLRYFRKELLKTALNWSWFESKLDVRSFFELLTNIDWYIGENNGGNIDRHIAKDMRSEANLFFGRRSRYFEPRGEAAEIKSYKSLVADLLEKRIQNVSDSEELGYFMLRHTSLIDGRTAHIPKVYWDEVDLAQRIVGDLSIADHYPITKVEPKS